MNALLKAVGRGYRAIISGVRAGGRGGFGRLGHDAGADYNAEAGARIDSSVVYPAILFGVKAIALAQIKTYRPDPKTQRLVEVPNHAITLLLNSPVPWYDGALLKSCWVTAMMLAGNGYTLKRRSGSGRLVGLEYVPLEAMMPSGVPGSGKFVDTYRLATQAGYANIAPEDVLHLRWHTLNPWNPALGLSPLEAVLPEIASDKRASRMENSLLRNGHKMHLVAPEPAKDDEGNVLTFGKAQRDQFQESFSEMGTGDSAGELKVLPFPMKVLQVGWSPRDMAFEHTHNLSEERVGAAFQIPLVLLGLGSGLEQSNQRAGYAMAVRQGLFGFTIPLMQHIGAQLTKALVPELGQPGDIVAFDFEEIPAYREYMAESDQLAAGGPTESVNEVRERKGLSPVEGGDQIRSTTARQAPAPEESERPDKTQKDPKPNEDEDSA